MSEKEKFVLVTAIHEKDAEVAKIYEKFLNNHIRASYKTELDAMGEPIEPLKRYFDFKKDSER